LSDLDRLRAAQLSPFDVKTLSMAIEVGGEFPFYVDRLKPETKDAVIAGMNSMIARDLLVVVTERSLGHRWVLRLTDHGRAVCAELDKMNAKKVIEVTMKDDAPIVAGGGTGA